MEDMEELSEIRSELMDRVQNIMSKVKNDKSEKKNCYFIMASNCAGLRYGSLDVTEKANP